MPDEFDAPYGEWQSPELPPENDRLVIVYEPNQWDASQAETVAFGKKWIGYHDSSGWIDAATGAEIEVSHWMELPPDPE